MEIKNDLSHLPCSTLRGVGESTLAKLNNLGIHTLQDLLLHLPLRYEDRTRIHPIGSLSSGDYAVIEGIIENTSFPKGGRTRLLCQIRDFSGFLHLRFFYINASQLKLLKSGVRVRCFGEIRRGKTTFEMIHPEYKIINENNLIPVSETLTPIYPTTEGLNQITFRKLIEQVLQMLKPDAVLTEIVPREILEVNKLPSLKEALSYVHKPPADAPVEKLFEKEHISQKRLVFEELLAHRLSLLHLKKTFQIQKGIILEKKNFLIEKFLSLLPFELTLAQQRVVSEIESDLKKPHPMLRLVQGDVGSGKTVIAALAILQVIENDYQCAFLAPTELLVEQHFQTFKKWFSELNIQVVLLSGQMKISERKKALSEIKTGKAQIILGTHALFQKKVTFYNLALIVVDEQHRFGVQQRALLREKGTKENYFPHQLIMTATPIPRTLAMSVYADLDYSIIDELPPGRKPISTILISNTKREEVLQRIRKACLSGRQAYWVCTLIHESEFLECQAAENTMKELQSIFPELKIGLLHGQMKSIEKELIMSAFKNAELQLLVATTVIEVGVDVPNASLMVIENSERLGLAQLHQLRGRVGRGAVDSHCVLMYQYPLSKFAKARLEVMRETTDGFKIAQRDLEIRGPGEVLGTRQTGDVSLRIADLIRDNELIPVVTHAASIFMNEYPELISPLIKRWLRDAVKYGHV